MIKSTKFIMLIPKISYLLIVLILLLSPHIYSQNNSSYKLGTALKSGGYYSLGESIKKILLEEGIKIQVIETNGSVENINLLNQGILDFAIVQNDIAFFADNGLYPFPGMVSDLNGIITFYKEPLYIVTNNPSILNIDQLRNLKINVGPQGGGLFTDAKILFNSVGIWENSDKSYFAPETGIKLLETGEIQAALLNSISDKVLNKIKSNKLFLLSLNKQLIELLSQTFPYLSFFNQKINGKEITTISVKSILVAKKSVDHELVLRITKKLFKDYNKLVFPNNLTGNKKEILFGMSLESWHSGSLDFYNNINLINSNKLLKYLWYLLLIPVAAIIFILLANLLFMILRIQNLLLFKISSHFIRYLRNAVNFLYQNKYIVICLLLVTFFLSDLFFIQYLEHKWAIRNNALCVFDNRSFLDNILWLFVFGGSGYNTGDVFPQDPLSQVFVTLIPIVGLSGFFSIVAFLTSDHIKNQILEMKGLKSRMTKDHIIICGWNSTVPNLIKDLLNKDYTHQKQIVVLANHLEEMPFEKYSFDKTMVAYIRGDATERAHLDKAHFAYASIVVIVPDDSSNDQDAKNILKTLVIENYSKELELKGNRKRNIYTILELVDLRDLKLAEEAKVDEIISLGEIKSKVMAQTIHNPGVSQFFNEILNFNEFNELYSMSIDKNSKLIGKTFDELLLLLRKSNILLVSINVKGYRTLSEVTDILIKNNLKREVITNPISDAENSYKVMENDVLIVLAESEKVIDEFVCKPKKTFNNYLFETEQEVN